MNAATRDYLMAHAGDNPATISAALAADPRLAINIDTADFSGFVYGDPDRLSRLKAVTAMTEGDTATLAFGISSLLDFLATRAKWVGTAVPVNAAAIQQALTGLQQVYIGSGGKAGWSPAECSALNALGGGFYFDRLSADEVKAELDTQAAAAAAAAAVAERNTAISDLDAWANSVHNALAAVIGALRDNADSPPSRSDLAAIVQGLV